MNRVLMEFVYQVRYGIPIWFLFLLCSLFPDIGPFMRLRGFLVSLFLPGMPKGLTLGRDVTLLSINRLIIGNNVYLAKGVWINAVGGVTIGDDVVFAPYVVASSTNHGFKDGSVKKGGSHPSPISIGFGTWIASHSVVTAGVTVGKGNLIGANSVVTKDSDKDSILVGVPARFVRARVDNPSGITSKHEVKF